MLRIPYGCILYNKIAWCPFNGNTVASRTDREYTLTICVANEKHEEVYRK